MGKPANLRRVSETEARAFAGSIRVSPRKLNLIAQSIRGKKAEAALAELTFSPRRIAREVKRVLESAIANAENNHQLEVDRLVVAQAFVGKALIMKRWHARARGRGSRIMKPFSNLTIVVAERAEQAAKTAGSESKESA
ncbi:MAG: 50S ribosomal protein L22 [Alphaproteobacteria bacterium]|nr:50S ribosomal protein L22 [Alphaproteobacteria bacterium]